MEKQFYYRLEDNADMGVTCRSLCECGQIIENDFLDIEPEDRENVQYTITPMMLTEEEYMALDEWSG